jgi:hypothetical protein
MLIKVMIMKTCALLLLAASLDFTAEAQGTFQDLNFESARIILDTNSPYYPNAINAANALPGWTVGGENEAAPDVLYNTTSSGAPAVSLQGPGSFQPILQGSFTVELQGSSAGAPASVSIGQTGQIPAGSASLQFFGADLGNLQVLFDGQPLSYGAIGTGPNYTIYGADISAYAGQTGQLLFTALPDGTALIDNIQFFTVPEPTTCALILCGTFLFAAARHARQPILSRTHGL